MIWLLVIIPFLLAFILSSSLTGLTLQAYRTLGIVDKSTKKDHPKHIHDNPVPRGGGIPIFFSMLLAVVLFITVNSQMVGIFAGAFILLVLGVLDDIFELSPHIRLIFGFLAAGLVVFSGTGIDFVSNPFSEGVIHLDSLQYTFELWGQTRVFSVWADLLALLWIVWGMNFVNMGAKGLDGQLPGVVIIAASVMGVLSLRFVNGTVADPSTFLSFALAGAYAGFLIYNFFPQKIMPGWGGGSLAGYFLAVLAILSGAKLATALIVLGVPLMDVIYAIIRRTSSGKSPVWGDDKHLHHFLLRLGWGKRRVALFYWFVTALLGGIALQLNSEAKIYTLVLVAVVTGGLLLWLSYFISLNQQE